MQFIGILNKILISKYYNIIKNHKIILTDERKKHVENNHPRNYEKFIHYLSEVLKEPDYILENKDYRNSLLFFSLSI